MASTSCATESTPAPGPAAFCGGPAIATLVDSLSTARFRLTVCRIVQKRYASCSTGPSEEGIVKKISMIAIVFLLAGSAFAQTDTTGTGGTVTDTATTTTDTYMATETSSTSAMETTTTPVVVDE